MTNGKKIATVILLCGLILTGCKQTFYHVTVYGQDGTPISEYHEVASYTESEGGTRLFFSDGKFVVIKNGIVVFETE